jgi:aromatic ring hydroxylase
MKYLAAKAGVPTEHRLRALRMVKDLIGHGFDGAWFRKETGGRAKKAAA